MRSRIALVLLPVAVILYFARPHVPEAVPLHVHLGARGVDVRQLDLKFERDESIARDLSLAFPGGAPRDLDRTVRLAPGDYQVAIRVLYQDGHQSNSSLPQHASAEQPIDLDLTTAR